MATREMSPPSEAKKGVDYIIRDPEVYRNQKVLIAGGGDSTLVEAVWSVVYFGIAGCLNGWIYKVLS